MVMVTFVVQLRQRPLMLQRWLVQLLSFHAVSHMRTSTHMNDAWHGGCGREWYHTRVCFGTTGRPSLIRCSSLAYTARLVGIK